MRSCWIDAHFSLGAKEIALWGFTHTLVERCIPRQTSPCFPAIPAHRDSATGQEKTQTWS